MHQQSKNTARHVWEGGREGEYNVIDWAWAPHTHTQPHIQTYTHSHTQTQTQTNTNKHTHTHNHTNIHRHRHRHTHAHTHRDTHTSDKVTLISSAHTTHWLHGLTLPHLISSRRSSGPNSGSGGQSHEKWTSSSLSSSESSS